MAINSFLFYWSYNDYTKLKLNYLLILTKISSKISKYIPKNYEIIDLILIHTVLFNLTVGSCLSKWIKLNFLLICLRFVPSEYRSSEF